MTLDRAATRRPARHAAHTPRHAIAIRVPGTPAAAAWAAVRAALWAAVAVVVAVAGLAFVAMCGVMFFGFLAWNAVTIPAVWGACAAGAWVAGRLRTQRETGDMQ
jgi:hypothetical protein